MKRILLSSIASLLCLATIISCETASSELLNATVVDYWVSSSDDIEKVSRIDSETGTEYTEYNYDIEVDLEVGSSTKSIEISLCNTVIEEDKEYLVESFVYGEPSDFTFEYTEVSRSSSDVSNVMIIDSAVICKLPYENFDAEYVCQYQVAVYDDGKYAAVLPYEGFDEEDFALFSDTVMSNLECEFNGNTIYARRMLTQIVNVSFKGDITHVNPIFTKKMVISTDGTPAIYTTKVTDKTFYSTFNSSDLDSGFSEITARLTLEHTWSDGSTTEETITRDHVQGIDGDPLTSAYTIIVENGVEPPQSVTATAGLIGSPTATSESDERTHYTWDINMYIKDYNYTGYASLNYMIPKPYTSKFISEDFYTFDVVDINLEDYSWELEYNWPYENGINKGVLKCKIGIDFYCEELNVTSRVIFDYDEYLGIFVSYYE